MFTKCKYEHFQCRARIIERKKESRHMVNISHAKPVFSHTVLPSKCNIQYPISLQHFVSEEVGRKLRSRADKFTINENFAESVIFFWSALSRWPRGESIAVSLLPLSKQCGALQPGQLLLLLHTLCSSFFGSFRKLHWSLACR